MIHAKKYLLALSIKVNINKSIVDKNYSNAPNVKRYLLNLDIDMDAAIVKKNHSVKRHLLKVIT